MLDLRGGGMTDGPILRDGDCATFEGRQLSQIVRSRINEAHELRLVFEGETGEGTTRSCTEAEFRQLIAAERLVIRAGRGAASPQALLRRSVNTLGASQRNRAYRKAYLARLVDDLHREGMPLTDAGIRNHLARIEEADRRRQRLDAYGTEHSRPNQLIAALPSPYTLLKYRRILAANASEPIALAPARRLMISHCTTMRSRVELEWKSFATTAMHRCAWWPDSSGPGSWVCTTLRSPVVSWCRFRS